ncbi:RNase adapter RapZ [Sphingomonas sabuli]|uniref:RNase adapter RapZ n=1 Tax=Sphingomonas sabuli TaxID=2764186 RepID=A0A7G9L335_9SPHN|nr:RNase adapter RapZ [Sphingomonas sabuli]QNM83034.1 RNase adapter RapZ [Sphingomonas sabuli]
MNTPPIKPRLLLVTGLSGAGKSSVLDALEDMGWDTVDNLPADLLEDFVHGPKQCRTAPVAVGMDVRSRGFDPGSAFQLIHAIDGVQPEVLYLDCSPAELERRYSKTRRRHPLALDRPAEDGIEIERRMLMPLHRAANAVIDTTVLTPVELRQELQRRFGTVREPVLTLVSFGFGLGVSRTADLVFDMRFLANPYWVDDLREQTGEDADVQAYVATDPAWGDAMDRIESLLTDWIPRYWSAGKNYLTVAFGCTGGRHRSVAAAIEMAKRLQAAGYNPNIRHRDLAAATGGPNEPRPGTHPAQ